MKFKAPGLENAGRLLWSDLADCWICSRVSMCPVCSGPRALGHRL